MVLPAHGRPFIGAHKRLNALINHHEQSLEKLHAVLSTPKRAVDVFDVLFKREIDDSNLIMATGESLGHLNCLLYRGLITKSFTNNQDLLLLATVRYFLMNTPMIFETDLLLGNNFETNVVC